MLKINPAQAAAWLLLCGAGLVSAAPTNSLPASPGMFVVEPMEIGLPQNSVIALTQSRDGYLWLGTLKGLVRFDGVQARVFDDDNTPGLNSSVIVHLFEDSRTNLWAGTEAGGVAVIRNGQVFATGMGAGSPERRLVSSCEDATGAVWFYCANGELWRFANANPERFLVAPGVSSRSRSIIAEKSGPVWIGTDDKLRAVNPIAAVSSNQLSTTQMIVVGKLDFLLASQSDGYWRLADRRIQFWKTNQLVRDFGAYPWATNASVSAACEDREGNLIVGTLNVNDGVYWFDAAGRATRISHDTDGLSHDGILSLCVDREGSLWVGTDGGGLNRVKKSFCDVLEESRNVNIESVCEDADGGLWISWGGAAIYRKDELSQRLIPKLGGVEKNVSCVFVDHTRRVWAGTRNGGLFQWTGSELAPVPGMAGSGLQIFAIFEDRRGRIWVGTQAGLARWDEQTWKVFTTRDGLSANAVRALAEDRDGNLWIGTDGGGLSRWRDEKLSAVHKSDGLPSEKISSLWVDSENILWAGTDGGGLARFQGGKWSRFSKDHGLASNRIAGMLDDAQGNLWIASNAGLMRVPKKSFSDIADGLTNALPCRTYGKADGLPTLECSQGLQPSAWRARDGTLWFSTIKGLVSVNPAQLKRNTVPPPVMIESVVIDGRQQNTNSLRAGALKSVTIPANRESLDIRYTSLNLTAADRTRFKYRLEGHDDWFPAGDSRTAHYSKLPPGDYLFHVAAGNEDGVWNEDGATLAVTVLPPFWKTWWFRIGAGLVLAGLIAGAVYYVATQKLQRQLALLKQQEALEKERARIARDLHDQLGANLTQISLLGEMVEADKKLPDEVEAHARQISATALETTTSLDEIVWAANPANDTLDSLVTYACKYAQDYLALAGLRHRLDVPADLPTTPLAPDLRHNIFLAFKESINNVVKHAQASEARIRLRLDGNRFTFEIEDNGRGPADANKKTGRNGLRNMRKRMEDVGGNFSMGPAAERGTIIRLTAPLTKN